MISPTTSNSLLNYSNSQSARSADGSASASVGTNATVKAKAAAATSQAALTAAGSTYKASSAGRTLDKQQTSLAKDMRAAMTKARVNLSGAVEFSVSSDGKVAVSASDVDKAAMTAFLKADTSQPTLATRIATQARDALKVSATIQQSAAISQAARYGGKSGGVMSLYTSLMQQSATDAAVFTFSAGASSLSYAGSLATKA